MKIIIDIPENIRVAICQMGLLRIPDEMIKVVDKAIQHSTPLPKGHGAIKDVSQIEIPMCEDRAYEKWVQVAINSAPTIIEADKGETE